MKKFEDKFNTIARNEKLTQGEKDLMRERLVRYMELKPEAQARAVNIARTRGFRYASSFVIYARFPMFAALVLLVGSGVSFAAEQAVPGEPLYTVKVSINEPIRAALAVSARAKAAWETDVASRRLSEAETLASRGNLTPAVAHDLELRFTQSAEAASQHIEKLKDSEPEAAVVAETKFQASLEAHQAILSTVGSNTENTRGVIASTAQVRKNFAEKDESKKGEGARTALALAVPVEPAPAERTEGKALALRSAAAEALSNAKKALADLNGAVTGDDIKKAKDSLDAAENAIAQGDAAFAGETNAPEAVAAYRAALNYAQSVSVVVKAASSLNIPSLTQILPVMHEPSESGSRDEERSSDTNDAARQTVYHQYGGGAHRFTGTIELPNSCITLTGDGEATAKVVTLTLKTEQKGDLCAQVMTPAVFDVSIAGDSGLAVKLILDDKELKADVKEGVSPDVKSQKGNGAVNIPL